METPATPRTAVLGRPLADYVEEKRADGQSWRTISRDLYVDTDRQVDIAYETLRTWFSVAAGASETQA